MTSRRTVRVLAVASVCTAAAALPAAAQAFNPQPDPPGVVARLILNPGVLVGFNPQPDPPGFILRISLLPPDPISPPDPCRTACNTTGVGRPAA